MSDTPIPSRAENYRFGPYRLQARPLGLYRDGEKLALPVQPLRLLSLLLSRGGELVTQDQIREAVWPNRTVDFTGSTHVAIRQIRAALDDDAANPAYIETVPRQGYRFVATVRSDGSTAWWPRAAAVVIVTAALALAVSLQQGLIGVPQAERSQSTVAEPVRLGEYLLGRAGGDSAQRSLAYFQTALMDDPDDGRALAGAAHAAIALADFDAAHTYVRRAQEVSPDTAATHDAAGALFMLRDWNWVASRDAFGRALALDPERASAHHGLAALDALAGRFDDAIAHMEEARLIDPASTLIQADYGWFLYYAGRYEDAAQMCERALSLETDSSAFLMCMLRSRAMQGRPDAALPAIEALLNMSGISAEEQAAILSRTPDEAIDAFERWRLERYLSPERAEPVPDLTLAYSFALTGDTESALVRLQRAIDTGSGAAPFALIDPVFAPLHPDDRFQAMAERILPAR